MMAVLLIAGVGFLLAGLLAIAFGIPVKEFSFGNTLIVTGVIGGCTGMIMLGFWKVVRELKNIAQRLGPGLPKESRAEAAPPSAAFGAARSNQTPEDGGFLFSRDQAAAEKAGAGGAAAPLSAPSALPWHEEAAPRDRVRDPSAPDPEAAPTAKPRRNLLFSSSLRKDRERTQARTADSSADDFRSPASSESSEVPPPPFEDGWPKSERSPPFRRSRASSTSTETGGAPAADRHSPAAHNEDQPAVTVLKSGVVDGMAYSLYSDGSIEAQMPEGMMRFASIEELRAHLDQRP